MDKQIKTKWVKALRSGRYKQGDGVLYADDKTYCCLGVLCAVQGVSRAKMADASVQYAHALNKSAGLTKRSQHFLVKCNDDKKWSFARIAKHIERTY